MGNLEKKKFLAIDLGASSGRAILGTLQDGRVELTELHRFSNDPVEVCGEFHWDILRLFYEIKTALNKCSNQGHSDIQSLAIDTWGVDFGLLDKDGKLVGNPFHYRDARTEGMIEQAAQALPIEEHYRRSGISFQNFNTVYQLYSMVQSQSHELKDADALLFTPDLLSYLLTGKKVCEYSIASTSAMLDAHTRTWSKEILDQLSIPTGILQEVVKTGTVVGTLLPEIAEETGMPQVPVIAGAGHDTAAAVACVPTQTDNFAFLSSGTWSLMGMEAKEPMISEEIRLDGFTNEGGVDHSIRFLKNIMGMWLIQESKRYWARHGQEYTYDELDDMANQSQAFYCFVDPNDASFNAPGKMPEKIQEYCRRTGQNVPQTPGQIVRCIYDSLALTYKETFMNLEKIRGRKFEVFHIVGGGIKNKLLCQYTANAVGKTVVAGPVEATAMGNILVQAYAQGIVKNVAELREVARRSTELATYEPQDMAAFDEAYKTYKKVVG